MRWSREVKFIDLKTRIPVHRRIKEATGLQKTSRYNINRIQIAKAWIGLDTNDQETQQGTGTSANRRWNNFKSDSFSSEQWRSKPTNRSRPSWYIWRRVTSRPHRLMKTSSIVQSKCRDLQLKRPHREKNNTLIIYFIIIVLTVMNNNTFFKTMQLSKSGVPAPCYF